MSERWAQKLSVEKLEQIADRTPVTEVHGDDGGPFRRIKSMIDGSDAGETRIFVGDGAVKKVVYHAITSPMIGLDSHMIFAFTDPTSPVPHWTFDSVEAGGVFAFHLDLIPRVDLGAHLGYMDEIYGPVTDAYETGRRHPGLTEPELSPRQRSLMSQWMLAYRVPADEYKNIGTYVQAYLDNWYSLLDNGVSDAVREEIAHGDPARRDASNRAMIFNRAVDPVWDQVLPLIGAEQSELMRLNLVANDMVHEVPAGFAL